jgi:hypothetical protein
MKKEVIIPKWNIDEVSDYKPITNLWEVFRLIEVHSIETANEQDFEWVEPMKNLITVNYISVIENPFNRKSIKIMTELAMVLNWSIFLWWEQNEEIGKLYDTLWKQVDCYIMNNFSGEDLSYYIRTTD